ncbi:MAG: aspartyl protease family protein [Sediminibacterium sp.]|nr:aspartyl protease family protein [Sediminibacterium sp.]
MTKKCLLGLALLICFTSYSQEEFVAPDCILITKIPFTQLSGGIIIVRAKLDQYPDSLNFVFDTGSGGISLDSATAADLKLPLVKSDKTIRGIAGFRKVEFAENHQLNFKDLTADRLDFHINDYELLTSVYGVKIDGIIGYSFIRRYVIKIDYDVNQLEIYSPGNFRYPRGGQLLRPSFTTLPRQIAQIEDGRQIYNRYIFDTGAGLCFLLSRDFVEDSSLFKPNRKFYPTQAEGLGGKKQMELTVVKSVKIGAFKFRNVPVHVFDDTYNVTSYPLLGGILGNDLLRRFNVILNYPQQSIHIKPNSHFNEQFDYSYTGLGIYLIDGEIRVIDIIKDSPGDRAGFKTGDVIFSVESNYSKNIQTYKTLFQNAIGKIKTIIFRDQTPMVLTLDVKDIRK